MVYRVACRILESFRLKLDYTLLTEHIEEFADTLKR